MRKVIERDLLKTTANVFDSHDLAGFELPNWIVMAPRIRSITHGVRSLIVSSANRLP